jgi:hypothetical protein
MTKSSRVSWARAFGLGLFFAVTGCSSLDTNTTSSSSSQQKTPVPGEVNPDAPDAAQTMRTQPGFNF